MPDTFHHGVRVVEITTGARPIRTVATAVIGLIGTGETGDFATAFPLNTPVRVTNIDDAIGLAGGNGTLKAALRAIASQTAPVVVVVRVAAGQDADETESNVIGGAVAGVRTGVEAFLNAESVTGVRPRILGAPGLDTQDVTTALAAVAIKLNGRVYASCGDADTIAEAVAYRENFSQREVSLIYGDFTFNGATVPAVAVAMGLRAQLDETIGFHKTISNVGVQGVSGLTRPVQFDLLDPDTDVGALNAADVTACIRFDGFRFWGNRTCSDEPLFAFESAARTAQILRDTIAWGVGVWAADKPLSAQLAKDIVEAINAKLRELKANGRIMGGRAWLDITLNPAGQLNAGKMVIDYDFTAVAPLEDLTLQQRITDKYYVGFAEQPQA